MRHVDLISPRAAWRVAKKFLVVAAVVPSLVLSGFGAGFAPVAFAVEGPTCDSIELVSGTDSQTAGYTVSEPSDELNPVSYEGSLSGANETATVIPPWVDPTVEADLSGAEWISTDASNNEGTAADDQWRLFEHTFNLPAGAVVSAADLWYTADNAVSVYLNDAEIDSTGDVFGAAPSDPQPQNFAEVFNTALTPTVGDNTLNFVVRNWSTESDSNPTGLIYRAVIDYCIPPAPENVTVTIAKYIDGEPATGVTADNADFPMSATWSDLAEGGIGAGTGEYALTEVGFNNPNPYQATTADMKPGADYSTNEILTGDIVGETCEDGKPFALQGYTTGDTMDAAEAGTPSLTPPELNDMQADQYVIVWNEACVENEPAPIACSIVSDTTNMVEGDGNAVATYDDNAAWTAAISGATWIWSDEFVQEPVAGETQTFLKSFNLSGTVTDATLEIAADNAYVVYINDVQVAADPSEDNFSSVDTVIDITDNLVLGENTLKFVVTNMPVAGGTSQSNPAGLLYKLTIDGGVCAAVPTDDDGEITVTIHKFIQGQHATADSADSAEFPMSATWNEVGEGGIGAGTGPYNLGPSNPVPYEAETIDLNPGSDYSTSEVLTGPIVAATCEGDEPFALQGYTTGDTLAEAMAATPSLTVPAFTNLQGDKHVIVWNRDCALSEGEIGGEVGDAALAVTAIDNIDTSATADGTFASGWEYLFHITTPMSEENLQMKFSNWQRTGGGGTIPVANNMRISSAQANNGGATILLTAADTYSTPPLVMVTDLNPVMAGRQVEVTVEVAVPVGTPDGSYTTNYGVQTTP